MALLTSAPTLPTWKASDDKANQSTLIDTGPIVAVINRRDAYHSSCLESLGSLRLPLLTCLPVLTEAVYLLGESGRLVAQLFGMIERAEITLLPIDAKDLVAIGQIIHRYEDQRLGLADASLLHLADREQIDRVFTIDKKNFSVYQPRSRRPLHLLPE